MAVEEISMERNGNIPIVSNLAIRDELLSKGCHAIMSPRSGFLTYGVNHDHENRSAHTQPTYLHEVTPNLVIYNYFIRRIVNGSHCLFKVLNDKAPHIPEEKRPIEITKFSQRYRSVLLACIEELQQEIETTNDEELLEYRMMLIDIELIWNLIESLVIDVCSGSRVLYKLLAWIKWHCSSPELKEELFQAEDFSSPKYWNTVVLFILQGSLSDARSLLSLHAKHDRCDFVCLNELLEKMPMYEASCEMSLNEFHIRWRHWQEECRMALERGEFSGEKNLYTICQILCGNYEALTEKSYLCGNWYHLMISVLLYTNPCISMSELGDTARTYYNNVNGSPKTSSVVDSLILSILELDILTIINLCCKFNDGWWFAVHIMDLLVHGNYISLDSERIRVTRSYLMRNYAEGLFGDQSIWQCGINYLDHCEQSSELLETYLEHIPLKDEHTAKKIVHFAQERHLNNLVKTVANVMTSRSLTKEMLGSALYWISISKDVRYADKLAERWMQIYIRDRNEESFGVFQSFGPSLLVCDKLAFVGKYCEFHKLVKQGEIKASAALLVSLIFCGLAPHSFQLLMLMDALSILQCGELIFSASDTYRLMACLENISNGTCPSDQEKVIRLALVKNLSRSCIVKDDSDSEGL